MAREEHFVLLRSAQNIRSLNRIGRHKWATTLHTRGFLLVWGCRGFARIEAKETSKLTSRNGRIHLTVCGADGMWYEAEYGRMGLKKVQDSPRAILRSCYQDTTWHKVVSPACMASVDVASGCNKDFYK